MNKTVCTQDIQKKKKTKSKIQSIAIFSERVKGNIYIQVLKPLKITKLPQTFVIELQGKHRCLNSEGITKSSDALSQCVFPWKLQ